ncbi:MAG: metallophosphoesterase [Bacteriovoracaceae bacterium]|nr:metallophosphoesterase [Bacteriovoracaceae bacterium]
MRIFVLFSLLFLSACVKNNEINLEIKGPVSACLFGDAGTGTNEQKQVAKLLKEEDCKTYFYLGDIIYPKGLKSADDPMAQELFLDVYKDILKDRDMFLMMGNHDYHGNVDAWIEIAKKHKRLHYPSHYYMVKLNDVCFPVMNTTDYKVQQLWWFAKLKMNSCKQKVLLGHHPAKSSGKHKSPYFPLNLFLQYAMSYANVYVAGHDHHLSYEGKVNGIDQFVSGAGGQLRDVNEELAVFAKSRLGFIKITEISTGLELSLIGLEDGERKVLYSKKITNRSLAND